MKLFKDFNIPNSLFKKDILQPNNRPANLIPSLYFSQVYNLFGTLQNSNLKTFRQNLLFTTYTFILSTYTNIWYFRVVGQMRNTLQKMHIDNFVHLASRSSQNLYCHSTKTNISNHPPDVHTKTYCTVLPVANNSP